MCDCEMPTFFSEYRRRARKPHRCCECNRVIAPGEHYQHASGMWDHIIDSFATCLLCADVRSRLVAATGCCQPFGEMFRESVHWMDEPERGRPGERIALYDIELAVADEDVAMATVAGLWCRWSEHLEAV